MKKIVLGFVLVFCLCIFTSSEEIIPILTVIEDSITRVGKIDENSGLFWARFINQQDNSEVAGIYVFNKSGKYRFIALYLYFETDKETFVLYRKDSNRVIGPIGSGVVKDDFVSWIYDMGIHSSPTVITFKHYKDFNVETKEGILVAKYEINLIELAKELT